jgi:hypothetical protein
MTTCHGLRVRGPICQVQIGRDHALDEFGYLALGNLFVKSLIN